MPMYEVNCPHCLEKSVHEADDQVQAAEKHVDNKRHDYLKSMNDAFRGFQEPNPGADTGEFNHGKEHNG